MKKTIGFVRHAILVVLCCLCIPLGAKASEVNIERTTNFSITDEAATLNTMAATYQGLLPEGKTAGAFTATIMSQLTNFSLCEYSDLFRQVQEQNKYGCAQVYTMSLSITGEDSEGNAYSYNNVTTTEPIELTLAVPEYLRQRPNRVFMALVKDASGKIIELGRGTETITFETDLSYHWYYIAYVDEPSTDRIDITVSKPQPGEKVGDAKYRPQTSSPLSDWDNNTAYTASYRTNYYRWSGTDPETGNGYQLGEDDTFQEGQRYSLSMSFYVSGDNPDVYINGQVPSYDIRSESGNWGSFSISYICTKGGLKQETATPVFSWHVCSDSDYEWDTIMQATETTDGEMRYQCKICGNIKYSVPITAYYQFNANTVDKIKNAQQGATVLVDTPVFVSFHEMVKDELAARTDVNLVVNYKYKGTRYQMLIPAGSAEKMATLFGTSKFCGFRNMASVFATESR